MEPRLLVTAFEPFGLPGRSMRAENASESVLRAIRERPGFRHEALVLPVDARCEVHLARALNRDPAGIVALGESGAAGRWDTNVEFLARDLPPRAYRSEGIAPEVPRTAAVLPSSFAMDVPLLPGMEREDRIGSYWCNRAYWRVLQWCRLFSRPAIFLHFRVEGDRRNQLFHLEHVRAEMEARLAGGAAKPEPPAPEPRKAGSPREAGTVPLGVE